MATIFHYNTQGADIFKGGISVLSAVRIQFLQSLFENPNNLCVVTDLGIQNSETIQFFLTFDDMINWFYFGKGMGSMTIRGLLLTSDGGTPPGLLLLLSEGMSQLRGQQVSVSVGNATFVGVMSNFSLNLTQDPAPMVEFQINLNIVHHTLPIRRRVNVNCAYNPSGF